MQSVQTFKIVYNKFGSIRFDCYSFEWQKFESQQILTNRPLSYVWLQFQGGSIILNGSWALNLSASVLLTDPNAIYIKIHNLRCRRSAAMLAAKRSAGAALWGICFWSMQARRYTLALKPTRRSKQRFQWVDKILSSKLFWNVTAYQVELKQIGFNNLGYLCSLISLMFIVPSLIRIRDKTQMFCKLLEDQKFTFPPQCMSLVSSVLLRFTRSRVLSQSSLNALGSIVLLQRNEIYISKFGTLLFVLISHSYSQDFSEFKTNSHHRKVELRKWCYLSL